MLGFALIEFRLLDKRVKPVIGILGKFAMADIFIFSMCVVVAKGIGIGIGIGIGEIEVAWGLYFFTGCVIVSLLISIREPRLNYAK